MKYEKPFSLRSKIGHSGSALLITIPSKKNIFHILFLIAWLGAWTFAWIMVARNLFKGNGGPPFGFGLFWLIGWTVGGIFAMLVLAWSLFGKEMISLDSSRLKIQRCILSIALSKNYLLAEIRHLRLNFETRSIFSWSSTGEFFGYGGGRIAFDYGMKTIKFAMGVDEAEAKFIIDNMNQTGFLRENQ